MTASLGLYTPSGHMTAPQYIRLYDENCMGNYYLDRDGKWMWDPNCMYKGTGPISGADAFGLADDGTVVVEKPWGPWNYLWALASVAGAATGAYHGYKRNNGSVGWAFGWSIFGGFLPFFSIPLSLAEGFGKPKKEK